MVGQPSPRHLQRHGSRDGRLRRRHRGFPRTPRSAREQRQRREPPRPTRRRARRELHAHGTSTRTIELASGRSIDALTFDGRSPGPELRVRQGDLVEVTLVNEDIEQGVTIHWHGVDVPNAEDGVAGVTQDAVLPGRAPRLPLPGRAGRHVLVPHAPGVLEGGSARALRSVRHRAGRRNARPTSTCALIAHTFDGIPTLTRATESTAWTSRPGTRVRLRLVNSDNSPHRFSLDRHAVSRPRTRRHRPERARRRSSDTLLEVAGGGRVDVAFTVPQAPVWLSLTDTDAALALNATAGYAAPVVSPELRCSTRRPTASPRPRRSTRPAASTAGSS